MIQVERIFRRFSVVNNQLLFGPPVGFNFPRLKVSACTYKPKLIYLLLGQEPPFSLKQTKQPGPERVIWGKSFAFLSLSLSLVPFAAGFHPGRVPCTQEGSPRTLHSISSALLSRSDRIESPLAPSNIPAQLYAHRAPSETHISHILTATTRACIYNEQPFLRTLGGE